jgi:N-acyl-D-amino-acid deacylase
MKKIFLPCLLLQAVSAFCQYDVLIRNGKIMDGTGNSWYYGDVAVKDGKIVSIGKLTHATALKTIDATGLMVAPGFIDVHGHLEGSVFRNPSAENLLYDGVTTMITGNCGGSAEDIGRFLWRIDSIKTGINIGTLIGHNTVRNAIMGRSNRPPTAEEQQRMEAMVEQAMKDGAVGFSTGLIYIPGTYATTEEIVNLAKAANRYNGVYASHIRDEGLKVFEAIEEAIHIGRQAGMPVQISHFKISNKTNWGRASETLALIEKARQEGYDVNIDQYVYTASSTNLHTRLPSWVMSGGQDSVVWRIKNTDTRKQILDEMMDALKKGKNKNYSYAVVASYSKDSTLNGKSISEINKLKGRKAKARQEAETILEMIENGGAQMVFHSMNENDLRYFLRYPHNMFARDAGIATQSGVPHPRTYGNSARVLGKYVREEKIISLEEAIRRMTSLPAQKFQLKDRGLLREGMAADLVLFDLNEVADKATFDNPHQYSAGFKYVLVNGRLAIENGKYTGERNGVALKGPGFSH